MGVCSVCMGVCEGVHEGDTVLEDIRYTQATDSQRSQPQWRRGQQ